MFTKIVTLLALFGGAKAGDYWERHDRGEVIAKGFLEAAGVIKDPKQDNKEAMDCLDSLDTVWNMADRGIK